MGDDFVRELDGMFAIALWDDRRKRLLLARDQFGKKPLLYAERGGRLWFGSEFGRCSPIPRSAATSITTRSTNTCRSCRCRRR